MSKTLRPGLKVKLPSGNVIVLVRREGAEWVCEYTEVARARGEVVFAASFLRLCAAKS